MRTRRTLLVTTALAFISVAAYPAPPSAFKITFGVNHPFHGQSWSGGIRDAAQVRRITGWHLGVEDTILPGARWHIVSRLAGGRLPAKGVIVEFTSPESVPVTVYLRYGDFTFVPAEIPYGKTYFLEGLNNNVSIERVPQAVRTSTMEFENDDPALLRTRTGDYWMAWVGYRTIRREGYSIQGGDRVLVARSPDGKNWSVPRPITPPGDHFRVALGQDAEGRIWCVYGLQKVTGSGNFDLFARTFDGGRWSDEQQLTSSPLPDIFHRMASDRAGNLYLVWMGYRKHRPDAAPQSDVLLRVRTAAGWGEEINVSDSAEDDWEPAVAVDGTSRAWIAWDAYRSAGSAPATYDLLLRDYRASGSSGALGPVRTVSATAYAEMRAGVAVDRAHRVWISWEEGGLNWGKDTGYNNPRHGIFLRPGGSEIYRPRDRKEGWPRRPRVAVLEGESLRQPRASLEDAFPSYLRAQLYQNPHLGLDGEGNVWVILRHQLVAQGRNAGHLFDLYATTLTGSGEAQRWLQPVLLPHSTGRQDTVLATAAGPGRAIVFGVVSDGRRLPVGLPEHHDVAVVRLDANTLARGAPVLAAFQPSAGTAPSTHPGEAAQVAAVRGYRLRTPDGVFKIVRGDLHRHTEISMDGATDGSLWDLYRYALDAAALDFIAVTDHNYGAWLDTDEPETPNTDDVYQWWRTQKSADLFHVPGRFVPLYGYERSINFPLGHVNVFHARRGIFSYRVPKLHIAERPELIEKDALGLQKYLSLTGGVGIAHTSGTIMGTDWRLEDDSVVPMVEIYQGDRNSYEEAGTPRAAGGGVLGPGFAGRAPFQKGLVRNALGAGFHLGFIASSDHYSTHISYANLLVPDRLTTRRDLTRAIEQRRSYASTDNIVVDFRAGDTLEGGELEAAESPVFSVRVIGTEPVMRVDVVKNNRVLYTYRPQGAAAARRELSFTFRDTADFGGDFTDTSMGPTSEIRNWQDPETGIRPRPPLKESYYYVRVLQSYSAAKPEQNGEVAWSSPIYVTVKAR